MLESGRQREEIKGSAKESEWVSSGEEVMRDMREGRAGELRPLGAGPLPPLPWAS